MAHLKATTYDGLKKLVDEKWSVKIGHNTYAQRRDNEVRIVLHSTTIAVLTPDKIEVHTGGWHTVTTKERLNQLLVPYGWRIYQANWTWYVHHVPWDDNNHALVFEDGMVLDRRNGQEQVSQLDNRYNRKDVLT